VNVPSRDRAPVAVVVLEDGLRVGRVARAGILFARWVRLAVRSPVVVPRVIDPRRGRDRGEVDLLPQVLTHVADVEVAGLAIEGVSPRVAEPHRPYLGPVPGLPHERIRRGHRVRKRVHVDPEELPESRTGTLPVLERIAEAAAVSGPDVEITVG